MISMPRPKKIDYTKLKFEPLNVELKLRIGKEGRIIIPGPIRDMYGLDEGKAVLIKILGVAEITKDAYKDSKSAKGK